ncbi:hypothetical protein ANN_03250, partial [Periplaneta americana]
MRVNLDAENTTGADTLRANGFGGIECGNAELLNTAASGEIHIETLMLLVGQTLPVHTQNIERKWLSVKYSMPVFSRRKEHFEGYFAE